MLVDTVFQPSRRPLSTNREACLVHIYPTGPLMGIRHVLGDKPIVIGRGEDCDIRILDNSVSRRHARVEHLDEGFFVLDMQSTNGTFVNDVVQRREPDPAQGRRLPARRQLHLPVSGGRQRRSRISRRDLPLTIINAYADLQPALLAGIPGTRSAANVPSRPAAVASHLRHRSLQVINDEMGPPSATTRCASWRPASARWYAAKISSPATAAKNSWWSWSKPITSKPWKPPSAFAPLLKSTPSASNSSPSI